MSLLDPPGVSLAAFAPVKSELAIAAAQAFAAATWFTTTTELPTTVTLTATGGTFLTSGITNARSFFSIVAGAVAETNFRYVCGAVAKYGSTFPRSSLVAQINNVSPPSVGNVTVEFMHIGTQLEIPWYGQAGLLRVCALGPSGSVTELLKIAPAVISGTAQSGSSTAITLAAGASATNGTYNQQWVYITGGTGSGSFAQITDYVGSTKAATVDPNTGSWVTPDATSVYEVRKFKGPLSAPGVTGSTYNILLTFPTNGPRRIRLETSGAGFVGVRTSATGDIFKMPRTPMRRMFQIGDSFAEGTGADLQATGFAPLMARALGCEPWTLASGGTGYLNGSTSANNGRLTLIDRITPPLNSWMLSLGAPTGGTYTLSYGGQTTTALAFNATSATLQSALEALSSIGAGNVVVLGLSNGDGGDRIPILFRNALATVSATLSIASSLTGVTGATGLAKYLGDLAPYVPTDGNGKALPFDIVLLAGHNDTTSSNAAYTPALLQSTVTTLIATLQALYPTASIYMTGVLYLPGSPGADVTAANSALLAASLGMKTINGLSPFIDFVGKGLVSGAGNISTPATTGNATQLTAIDGVHPSQMGHIWYAAIVGGDLLRIKFGG